MHFGAPLALFGLVLAEALALGFVLLAARRRRAAVAFGGQRAGRGPGAAYWAGATLVVLAATLAVLAMARPQWGSKEFSRQEQGIDLVVALDVSQSMTATDVAPSRLGLAQAELAKLLEALRGNRVGLVLFAGSAILRSPLSSDTGAVSEIIRRADKEPGLTRAGSDIGAALDQAGRILDASDSPGKAVLVVSDGEDFGRGAAQKTSELAATGIVVFSAGAGTPQGGTLQERVGSSGQTRLKLDAAGQPVVTRLDEAGLQAIAAAGGGRYLRLGASGGLLPLRDDLGRLQQTPLSQQTQRVPIERFQYFAAAALAALALAWLVPAGLPSLAFGRLRALRPRPGLALVLLALVLAGGCAGSEDPLRARNGDANKLYAAGDYQGALDSYQKLLAERPDVPEIAYNTGNTLDRLGQFQRAVEATRRALPSNSRRMGAATFYSLGNHYLALNQLEDAYDAYKDALLLDPHDADAKYNLELTLLRLQQQQGPDNTGQQSDQPQEGQGDQSGQTPSDQAPSGDASGDPGQQQTQPGQGQQPQPGQPAGPSAADIQRALSEALAGLNDDVSFEEAQQILDLLNQLRQQQTQPATGGAGGGGQDY